MLTIDLTCIKRKEHRDDDDDDVEIETKYKKNEK